MRQFVLAVPPDRNGSATLAERDYRYLAQVLRKTAGDRIEVRLPDGTLALMRIARLDRNAKTVSLVLENVAVSAGFSPGSDNAAGSGLAVGSSMPAIPEVPEGFPPLILFQWILKGPRMDQVVRQATETGVSLIVPVAGERCLSSEADNVGGGKTGRWDRIVREALQQSGSPVVTRVLPPIAPAALGDLWRSLAGPRSAALVLTEAPLARRSLHEYLDTVSGPTAIAVGPEGGMTARELALLEEAGFACVHFKTNILRAETAALYGIAAVQATLLESGNWQLKESNS
jgi:16S rRNA (uracil1498-N3)-methyltransferase